MPTTFAHAYTPSLIFDRFATHIHVAIARLLRIHIVPPKPGPFRRDGVGRGIDWGQLEREPQWHASGPRAGRVWAFTPMLAECHNVEAFKRLFARAVSQLAK